MLRIKKTAGICIAGVLMLSGCEIPGKPDFTASHKIEAPLLLNKEYQFLGSRNALIDSTKSDFESIFVVDQDNHIKLAVNEDFDFGNFDHALPLVQADPAAIVNEIGEINIGSFSSGVNNLGAAAYTDLSGMPAGTFLPAGTPVSGGQSPAPVNVDIGANTDFFVSAVLKGGGVSLSILNDSGLSLDRAEFTLKSGTQPMGTENLFNLAHGDDAEAVFQFSEGEVLEDLNVDVSIFWSAQTLHADAGALVIKSAQGEQLRAREVTAALEAQTFTTSGTSAVSDAEFEFGPEAEHFVQLKAGYMVIDPILNSIDLDMDTVKISFPGLRAAPYTAADSLVIEYAGNEKVVGNGYSQYKETDLSGYRIYARNNALTYNVYAVSENTQQAGSYNQIRSVKEDQFIQTSVQFGGLEIKEAAGYLKPKNIVLNDDEYEDGVVDVFNDYEADITELSGIKTLSEQLEGLDFADPELSFHYNSNLGYTATIYGVFLGISSGGREVYLSGSGKDGTYETLPGDPVAGLHARGAQIGHENIIKFEIPKAAAGGSESGILTFDESNSNVNEFLNNLPGKIRFVGKAVVNENGNSGMISDPINFDSEISLNVPLTLTAEHAVFKDTTDQDLGDFPSKEKGDANRITEGEIQIVYTNGIPLGFDIQLSFIDENNSTVTTIPAAADEPVNLRASDVSSVNSFAETPAAGEMIIALNNEQLEQLYKTRRIVLQAILKSGKPAGSQSLVPVKLRADDQVKLGVRAKITIETDINNK